MLLQTIWSVRKSGQWVYQKQDSGDNWPLTIDRFKGKGKCKTCLVQYTPNLALHLPLIRFPFVCGHAPGERGVTQGRKARRTGRVGSPSGGLHLASAATCSKEVSYPSAYCTFEIPTVTVR